MRTKPTDQSALLASILLNLRSQRASSRSTLAKANGLSPSTVGIYVDHLIALGYVNESGLEQGPMGRPKRKLNLIPDAGWFAGVEFNAERIQAVRVDFSGHTTASVIKPLPAEVTTQFVIDQIRAAILELSSLSAGKMLALGIGVPGLVDPVAGVALRYSFISDWKNVPLVETLETHFPTHVTLENNLRAIALAERWFGAGHELDNYVILGPRRGFGLAMMKNGQLIRGANDAAGEIGNWVWPLGGEGGELHDVLSAPAVWRRLSGETAQTPLPQDLHSALAALAKAEGANRRQVINDFGRIIGMLHLLLNAQAYFLHGPLTALGPRFCEEIAEEAVRLMPSLKNTPPPILASGLGDAAGALGAASLAMESWTPDVGHSV